MKNKTILYSALTVLVLSTGTLISMVLTQTKTQKIPPLPKVKAEVNSTVAYDTTILQVLAREKTDILSITTEIDDYVSSQKHLKEKREEKVVVSPVEEVIIEPIVEPVSTPKPVVTKMKKKVYHDNIPRLAIIMDDLGNANQIRAFKQIPFPITPSIFPATPRHPDTPMFAKEFAHYMVHMPMEAFHFARPEENTLLVSDSKEEVEDKIAAMYQDFPDAVAINNHTGSKFTSSAEAMERLFCALDKYDVDFVDSKTAPHVKGKEVGALHHRVVLERHIFLDNKPDVGYILNQLKKALRYAKRHGVAIAICHPRPETFKALQEAKKLFKGVKLVTIDELL